MIQIIIFAYQADDRDNIEIATTAIQSLDIAPHEEVGQALREFNTEMLGEGFEPGVKVEILRHRVLNWGPKMPQDKDRDTVTDGLLPSILMTLSMNDIISEPPTLDEWPNAVKGAQVIMDEYPLPEDAIINPFY